MYFKELSQTFVGERKEKKKIEKSSNNFHEEINIYPEFVEYLKEQFSGFIQDFSPKNCPNLFDSFL